jgi:hypothetical protein
MALRYPIAFRNRAVRPAWPIKSIAG